MKKPAPRRVALPAPIPLAFASLVVAVALVAAACVKTNPPTDVGNPTAPSSPDTSAQPAPAPSPTPSSGQALSYDQDLKPIFNSDCVPCHSGSRPSAGYSMSTYAAVMRDVTPGNGNSRLVVWTQPGGSMYRFWTGNASQKASMVKQWVVTYNAQQSR
jgi:hypothetical protein